MKADFHSGIYALKMTHTHKKKRLKSAFNNSPWKALDQQQLFSQGCWVKNKATENH